MSLKLSDFTKNIFKHIKTTPDCIKYSLNFIKKTWYYKWLKSINFEDINVKYTIKQLDKNLVLPEIIKMCYCYWVDTELAKKEIIKLNNLYEIDSENVKFIVLENNDKNKYQIIELLKYFEFIKRYFNVKLQKKPIIYFILTPLQKTFEIKNKIIDIHNVNSGYTDILNCKIFIWRLEEFTKVYFHELIHLFKLDKHINDAKINFEINGLTSYNEALTDYLGISFHIIYLNNITGKSLKKIVWLELNWIYSQAFIINLILQNKEIYQKSPAYSYYILKYFIFEYAFTNNPLEIEIHGLINKLVTKKIDVSCKKYIKSPSSRMSLIQLI